MVEEGRKADEKEKERGDTSYRADRRREKRRQFGFSGMAAIDPLSGAPFPSKSPLHFLQK